LLEQISNSVFYMPADDRTDRPLLGAIRGRDQTLIVDSGNSPAHARQFKQELKRVGLPPAGFLAITHWHWDHVFGMAEWDIPALAADETRAALEEIKDYKWDDRSLEARVERGIEIEFCAEMIKKEFPRQREQIKIKLPEISFPQQVMVDLGGTQCLLERVGGDHHPGSTVVFVPGEKVLFLGDCLGPDLYAPRYNYSPPRFLKLLEKIRSYGAAVYLSSHSEPQAANELEMEMEIWEQIGRAVLAREVPAAEIQDSLGKKLGRELNSDEREMLEYLLRGLEY